MALRFGKYRYTNIKGEKGSDWNIEIWKKDNADTESNGSDSLYPENSLAREFPNQNSFIAYWPGQGVTIPGWSWTSDNGGAARHASGNSDALPYNFNSNLLTNGAAYEVTIELALSSGQTSISGSLNVKLGTSASTNFSTVGVHTAIVTANGGQLSIDPTSTFIGDVKEISLKKYFAPALEFNTGGEGFEITWNGRGGTRDREFLGSECKLNYIVENNTDENFLYDSFNLGYREYFIRIYRGAVNNNNIWWYGWVQPAFDAIENAPYPYEFNITATDSYGFWGKSKDEFFSGEDEKNASHSIKNIFVSLGTDMGIRSSDYGNSAPSPSGLKWLRTSLDWWSSPHTYNSNNPALLYFVSKGFVSKPTTYDEDNNIEEDPEPYKYKPYDVFNGVLKSFNTVGFLAEGYYNFIQPNNLANNTTGDLTFYGYFSEATPVPHNSENVNTLLTIDQSSNVILQGSTINYEPSFERVTVNHLGGFSNFDIGSGQDLTTEFYAGSIQSGLTGQLNLSFFAKHYEKILKSDFNFTNSNYKVISSGFLTTGTLSVRITDGTNNRYLVQNTGSDILGWQSTSGTISIERGYSANFSNPVNDIMAVGLISNSHPTNNATFSNGPCRATTVPIISHQFFYTNILFDAVVEQPDISGDVYIQFTCDNDYNQALYTQVTSGPPPTGTWAYSSLNDPTPTQQSTTCENISLIPSDNNQDNDVTNGIIYTASQTNNTAIEQFDLGDVNLGQSSVNNLYSFQYLDGSIYKVAPGFTRGNSGAYINASQLLTNEFLQLQVEPLEILQADIQSADISPLKLVKYSINNDGSFKYYQFLGGTFKAQSEILSGEWYKVNSITTNIIEETTPIGPDPQNPENPLGGFVTQQSQAGRAMLENNSYALTNSVISSGSTLSKVTFSTNLKGAIKDNQKLLLTYPDGSNPIILTADGDTAISSNNIDVDAFTPDINYPSGSVISPLVYDLTNVITGGGGSTSPGGSDTQVQFNDGGSFGGDSALTYNKTTDTLTTTNLSITGKLLPGIVSIKILPRDFIANQGGRPVMIDGSGTNRWVESFSSSTIYASVSIPPGFKATEVEIYGNDTQSFKALVLNVNSKSASSKGTGNVGTPLNIQDVDSTGTNYLLIELQQSSTSEVYGGIVKIAQI